MQDQKNSGIQLLGTIACSAVLFQHVTYYLATFKHLDYSIYLKIDFGRIGVYIFFVISGYVITLSMKQGRSFAWRRLLRIFPTFWIAIFLSFLASQYMQNEWFLTLKSMTLLPSKIFNNSYNIPYWTLIYEVSFYFFIFILIISKVSKHVFCNIILGWLIIIVVCNQYMIVNYISPGIKIFISPINILFCCGALLTSPNIRVINKIPYHILALLSIILWTLSQNIIINSVCYYLLNAASYSILILILSKIKTSKIVDKIADASYGIYLIHVVSIQIFINILTKYRITTSFFILWPITLILCGTVGYIFGFIEFNIYKKTMAFITNRVFNKNVSRVSPIM